jgi:hypothetical protein
MGGSLLTRIDKWGRKQFINVVYNSLKKSEEGEKTFDLWNGKLSRKHSLSSLTVRILNLFLVVDLLQYTVNCLD